eukprot:533688-Alexandrium_andersonii.AAC.1
MKAQKTAGDCSAASSSFPRRYTCGVPLVALAESRKKVPGVGRSLGSLGRVTGVVAGVCRWGLSLGRVAGPGRLGRVAGAGRWGLSLGRVAGAGRAGV